MFSVAKYNSLVMDRYGGQNLDFIESSNNLFTI